MSSSIISSSTKLASLEYLNDAFSPSSECECPWSPACAIAVTRRSIKRAENFSQQLVRIQKSTIDNVFRQTGVLNIPDDKWLISGKLERDSPEIFAMLNVLDFSVGESSVREISASAGCRDLLAEF